MLFGIHGATKKHIKVCLYTAWVLSTPIFPNQRELLWTVFPGFPCDFVAVELSRKESTTPSGWAPADESRLTDIGGLYRLAILRLSYTFS